MQKNDVYSDMILEHWNGIIGLYKQFEDKNKNPVMLFDIQEQKIYSYPYDEFKKALSKKSQELLKTQYEKAAANDHLVIFVRDNEKKKLRSYTFSKE